MNSKIIYGNCRYFRSNLTPVMQTFSLLKFAFTILWTTRICIWRELPRIFSSIVNLWIENGFMGQVSGLQRFGFTQNDGILYIFGNLNNNTSYNIEGMKRQSRNSVFPVCIVTSTDLFDIFTTHTQKDFDIENTMFRSNKDPIYISYILSSWNRNAK